MQVFFVFNSENEKKCTLDQAFRGVLEEEIVSMFFLYLLLKFCWQISPCQLPAAPPLLESTRPPPSPHSLPGQATPNDQATWVWLTAHPPGPPSTGQATAVAE